MKFGIQQKVLAVLAGVLVLNTLLGTLLASYYTNRQNEEAAFTALGNDLIAWQSDLTTAATQLKLVAMATVNDTVVLTQLTDLMTVESIVGDPAKVDDRPQMLASLGYRKTASLNRLELALRTGRFDSIAVHARGRLSHFVSPAQVGMALPRSSDQWAWVSAPVDARGEMPFRTWPAWPDAAPPDSEAAYRGTPSAPEVSFLFEPGRGAVVQIAVPVQGLSGDTMTDQQRNPMARVYTAARVAGLPDARPLPRSPDELKSATVEVFAVVLFRKRIDRSVLEDFAKHSGKLPALFSVDGNYRQSLAPDAVFAPALVRLAADSPAAAGSGAASDAPASSRAGPALRRTVTAGPQSFYAALQPWAFEGPTRLVLGLATPQDLTVQNVRQTVLAILAASTAVLLLSLGVGQWWVRRYMSPIVQLTASVKAVSAVSWADSVPGRLSSAGRPMPPSTPANLPATLLPADLNAPDEVGELARAFNGMVGELQRSFGSLEQQVQVRTAALRQQERYLRTLIDMLPMSAWFKDAQSRYLVVNQMMAEDFGRSVDDMTGRFDAELIAAPLADDQRLADQDIMSARTGRSVEQHIVKDGVDAWRETYLAPVIDEDGSVLGIVGMARDISDRKAVEAARESALAEARHLAMQRSGFLAHMSHELRTPLNGILGFAQLLRQNPNLTEQQALGLAVIEESGDHLLKLITDILDLARIDAGRLDLRPEDFDLPGLLKSVCDLVRLKADEKRLRFSFEAADDLPKLVRLDKQRLRQVLLNLLSNAIKFTDAGAVSLRVQRAQSATPRSDSDAGASLRLRFEVQDAGIGLTPQQIERLFQPFEQFGDQKRREGGSGLGLAISQQLVRLMDGEIRVDSRPGVGSRFVFEIDTPIARQLPVPPAAAQPVPVGYAGRRRRILVVDDVAPNRAVMVGLLGSLGFELAEAEDGQQALDVTARWKPDLVVMDLMMPVMDGFEAIRQLRQQPETARLPIIAASASAMPQTEVESREVGADAFIVKPIQRHALIEALGNALGLTWWR